MNPETRRSSNVIDLIGLLASIGVMLALLPYSYHRPDVIAIALVASATALFLCGRIVKRIKNQASKI